MMCIGPHVLHVWASVTVTGPMFANLTAILARIPQVVSLVIDIFPKSLVYSLDLKSDCGQQVKGRRQP